MKIKKEKTQCMVLCEKGENVNIKIENKHIERGEKFKYLGRLQKIP